MDCLLISHELMNSEKKEIFEDVRYVYGYAREVKRANESIFIYGLPKLSDYSNVESFNYNFNDQYDSFIRGVISDDLYQKFSFLLSLQNRYSIIKNTEYQIKKIVNSEFKSKYQIINDEMDVIKYNASVLLDKINVLLEECQCLDSETDLF